MMKELEFIVMQRLRLDASGALQHGCAGNAGQWQAGRGASLRERVLAVLRVLAEGTKELDRGDVQMAHKEIVKRSGKRSSTVSIALREAAELGVIKRLKPRKARGSHPVYRTLWHPVLLETARAAQSFSAPKAYEGGPIFFPRLWNEEQAALLHDFQNLDVQNSEPNFKREHSARPPGRPGSKGHLGSTGRPRNGRAPASDIPGFAPAPGGRGGVSSSRSPRSDRISIRGESARPGFWLEAGPVLAQHGTTEFFHWLETFGVEQVLIEVQPRRRKRLRDRDTGELERSKIGSRGAPCAKHVPNEFGVKGEYGTPVRCIDALQRCVALANAVSRPYADLACRESGSDDGSGRTLLLDDVDRKGVQMISEFWPGPLAVLETSNGNFQVILIADRLLSRSDRSAILKALQRRFHSDPGALSVSQLHRFPGSPNWKPIRLDRDQDGEVVAAEFPEEPFICRLEAIRGSMRPDDVPTVLSQLISEGAQAAGGPEVRSKPRPKDGRRDMSSDAISLAMSELKRGRSDAHVLSVLERDWRRHHHSGWCEYTLGKAKKFLADGRQRKRGISGQLNETGCDRNDVAMN